jgi:sulfur carrier protein
LFDARGAAQKWAAEKIPLQPAPDNAGEGTAMSDTSYIIVNGQQQTWPTVKSLSDFLAELKLPSQVAIAINDRIVPRSRHAETIVNPGDRVEIVHPVGGG